MADKIYQFRKGEVLLVDKPLNWTSFDVVNKLRWRLSKKYGIKRFKVGHAGTLDPLATGLLIICTGKSTKISQELTSEDKTYTGTFLLGKTTPSYDLETEFDQEYPLEHITSEAINEAAESFQGDQKQTPPIFSAKKVNGKRAYESARKGIDVKLKENDIHIHSFKITAIRFPEVDFEIKCSKGTYIRSIANDFGKALDSGATLIALRRTQSGEFLIQNSKSVEEWIEIIDANEMTDELSQ
ncbi:tRNA pseudouridine(55) synthase TruB [Brumimicrobium aurantiacum]|uniref:tRNA pseudouridine synthase B n=1 Tax=Brumimicrobium aurantiacum TaxID=1737063 RepID=A0A3E1EVK8_9FLAO|nr:tRNA pseudouridine(55) synthase TruB [Brumimicrobium aurantiacum]RFC53558.1 tRNA pseudouridine(55) synthase TruB [Brumimicrobium aurantiacum]